MAVSDVRLVGDLWAVASGNNGVAVLPLKGSLSVSGAPVLSVRELVCGYAGVPVTAGVSFEVGPGEAVVLLGANGAGKSTVLRTSVGQQAAVSGDRWLKGGPVVENSLVYRRVVSCLFDEDAFLPGVSVGHHLELVLRGHGVAEAAVVAGEAVAEFGLGDRVDASPFALSSGQRRRALLAAALIRPFELLVLDEPEQRLDTLMRSRLADRLVAARDAGAGLLIATHDASLAEAVGTTVLAIDRDTALPPVVADPQREGRS
ncbi:ABC transporter ATP-binding protein [Kocuria flava]|uniref:ABC transporter ATP-binding protein n=1 Tax=Kocuria flava TaxID=446860 RepID=UPI0015DEFDFF|nr:ATP-binding cassette domain-containing protein [Kocuria flava]